MKKIGLLVFSYYLANSLSLINSATLLAQEGYDVHIFIDSFIYQRQEARFDEDNISVHPIDVTSHPLAANVDASPSKRWKASIANKAAEWDLKRQNGRSSVLIDAASLLYAAVQTLLTTTRYNVQSLQYAFHARALAVPSIETVNQYTERFLPYVIEFYQKVACHVDEEYLCLIGVEPLGLIAATLTAHASTKQKPVPVIYYSQELLLEEDCKTFELRTMKALEKTCNQTCYFTIIQDASRAGYLSEDNKLEAEKVVCVPVSGIAKVIHERGTFLQDTYGIPREKKILLYVGNIEPWAMCVEMAEAAQDWNDDWVFVLHSWREDLESDLYVNHIRGLTNSNKVCLSLKNVDWQKMPELVSSADIGLLFYQHQGENFYEVGHSSNKLVQYLQVGLPVIASDFPSLRDVIERYQCGECGTSPREIRDLAEKIFQDYSTYRANAFRCYESEYDFATYFAEVVKRIKELEVSL